jgi:hypothetical protein
MSCKLIFLIFGLLTSVAGRTQNNTHALVGVTIFNSKSINDLENMTILIENGLITDIFRTGSKQIADSINKIELANHYVLPGLIDRHVHMGAKGLSKSPEASREEFKRWIYSGVTAVRDMGGDARALRNEYDLIQSNKQPGPNIYYSATVGSSDMIAKDLRLKAVTEGIAIENTGYVIEANANLNIKRSVALAVESKVSGLKFYAGIPSDQIKAITSEAHRQGLKSWAHFTVFPDRPLEVVKAGVDVVSHVWGAFWQDPDVDPSEKIPFTHTNFENARSAVYPQDLSKLNTDSPELRALFKEMKERNVIWDLTYVVPNPAVQRLYKEYALAASKAGVTFCTGTDYFNDISEPFPSLFKEIETLVLDEIIDARQALLAATLNGAKAIGIDNTQGTVEIGKLANLVILKKNPIENISNIREIKITIKNGILYYRSDYK